jgi:hypothetical protein
MRTFGFYVSQPVELIILGIPISVLHIKGLNQILLLALESHIKKFNVGYLL